MKNIALIGMPLCGKTSVAAVLSEKLGVGFVDTDALIEAAENKTVPEIFAERGESGFRELERIAVIKACEMRGVVISTGGGTPLDAENARLLRLYATAVYLKASPSVLLPRLKGDLTRPLFASAADPEEKLYGLFRERERIYSACADFTVETDGKTVERIAGEIAELLR